MYGLNSINAQNTRMRFTREAVITNKFFQFPRFLMAGEFAGNKLSNNARILYTLLLDRNRVSIANEWFDENDEAYIYFKREDMEQQLGLSERTISKVMSELKAFCLVEEKKQGMGRANKIHILYPVIANNENPLPYLEPSHNDSPEVEPICNYPEIATNDRNDAPKPTTPTTIAQTSQNPTEPIITMPQLPPLTCKYCSSKPVDITPLPVNIAPNDPQDLRPIYNKYSDSKEIYNNNDNKEINNNNTSDMEGITTTATATTIVNSSDIVASDKGSGNRGSYNPPTSSTSIYSNILKTYNEVCGNKGLRLIMSINGKRKLQIDAGIKEYGVEGFFDLFSKTADSEFLCGGGERGWKADFDWLIDPANLQKVLEDKYDSNQNNIALPPPIRQIYESHQYSSQVIDISQTTSTKPLAENTNQEIYATVPVVDGVVIEPTRIDSYAGYRNKNGFNTKAALQQMLEDESRKANAS